MLTIPTTENGKAIRVERYPTSIEEYVKYCDLLSGKYPIIESLKHEVEVDLRKERTSEHIIIPVLFPVYVNISGEELSSGQLCPLNPEICAEPDVDIDRGYRVHALPIMNE